MIDRELLELAAKAAGRDGVYYECGIVRDFFVWNPLTDDGDALRLAVKLNFDVDIWNCGVTVTGENGVEVFEDACGDKFAETRRAIVIAAAEIGRTM